MSEPARYAALPSSITLREYEDEDQVIGPISELLALGLLKECELPQEGKRSITWLRGRPAGKGNHTKDETYRRVIMQGDGNASVSFGLPVDERKRRKREGDARRAEAERITQQMHAQRAADEKRHAAEDVRRAVLSASGVGPYADGPGQTAGQRIANIESLCRYALVAIQFKKGDSAKLARAEEDLSCAIDDLARLRWEYRDPMAEVMGLMGKRFASGYVRAASKAMRREEDDDG